MWLAARAKLPKTSDLYVSDPLALAGAVNLDGPADLKAALAVQQSICGRPAITELIGGSPGERPDRYRDASPIELLPLGIPQVFFAGRMFVAQVAPYAEAARRAGDAIQPLPFGDAPHFVFIDPQSELSTQVVRSIRELLSIPN